MSLELETASWPFFRDTQIRYSESYDSPASPEEEFRNDGTRIMRTFWCRWTERQLFIGALVGYPEIVIVAGQKYLARNTPHGYEDLTDPNDRYYLYCTEVPRVEGIGVPDANLAEELGLTQFRATKNEQNVATYGLAKVQALYETLTYEIREDSEINHGVGYPDESYLERYVTILPKPSAEAIPVQTGIMYWTDGAAGDVVPGFPSKLEPKTDVTVTWHQVPTAACGSRIVNPAAPSFPIDDALGKVNSVAFMGCPVATLLCTAILPRPIRSMVGLRLWDWEFHFVRFEPGPGITHLHQLRSNLTTFTISYVEAYVGNTVVPIPSNLLTQTPGKSRYDFYDFHRMFRVPT